MINSQSANHIFLQQFIYGNPADYNNFSVALRVKVIGSDAQLAVIDLVVFRVLNYDYRFTNNVIHLQSSHIS